MTGALMLLIFQPLGASMQEDALAPPTYINTRLRLVRNVDTYVRLAHPEP